MALPAFFFPLLYSTLLNPKPFKPPSLPHSLVQLNSSIFSSLFTYLPIYLASITSFIFFQ